MVSLPLFRSQSRAFTLVEIMVVVVVIGLLAALAIPAFKQARNVAIEKSLMNDARQLSGAAHQYFCEANTSHVMASTLMGADGRLMRLSSGTLLRSGTTGGAMAAAELWTAAGVLNRVRFSMVNDATYFADSVFTLGNLGYDAALSRNQDVTATYGPGVNRLTFAVESGHLVPYAYAPILGQDAPPAR